MKQIYCIHCHKIDPQADPDEYFVNEAIFGDHLERCHGMEISSIEAAIKSLKTLGMYEEREVADTTKKTI